MSLLIRLMVRPTRGSTSISSFSMWMIGPSSATNALTGSRTSASYSRRCSSNQGLLLFSASPDRNRNNPAEKPSKRTRFMEGLFGHNDYTNRLPGSGLSLRARYGRCQLPIQMWVLNSKNWSELPLLWPGLGLSFRVLGIFLFTERSAWLKGNEQKIGEAFFLFMGHGRNFPAGTSRLPLRSAIA